MSCSSKQSNKYWLSLSKPPRGVLWNGDMTMINPYEFIIAAECNEDGSSSGIYKYNKLNNKWRLFVQYPFNFESVDHRMTYNKHNHCLYLYGSNAQMTIIDISNYCSSMSTLSTTDKNIYNKVNGYHHAQNNKNNNNEPKQPPPSFKAITDCNLKNVHYPNVLTIHPGIVHIIGGQNNNKHLIWSNRDHSFVELHDFNKHEQTQLNGNNNNSLNINLNMGYSQCIYSSLHKRIIMIKESMKNINNIGGQNNNSVISKIWLYSTDRMRWNMLNNIEIPLWNVECVLTSDQRNLIITSGCDQNGNISDKIYVLTMDDDQFILRSSLITIPKKKWHYLMMTGNILKSQLLCHNYIKVQCGKLKCEIPPLYVVKLVANWLSQEMIHFLEKNGDDYHYAISVKRILDNVR